MRVVVVVLVTALLAVACGGGSSATTYQPTSSQHALAKAEWSPQPARGMKPISGGRQLGWLNVTGPDGTRLSLQFLESAERAKRELNAVEKSDPSFHGVRVGNILVFVAPTGHPSIPSADLSELKHVLSQ